MKDLWEAFANQVSGNPGEVMARWGAAPSTGIAPYGPRHDSIGVKGKGFFGPVKSANGDYSTEISAADELGDFPLMVPTLSRGELESLLRGEQPTEAIYKKARDHADKRRANGDGTFANGEGIYYPLPQFFSGAK